MNHSRIHVVTTTISGSIRDQLKTSRIERSLAARSGRTVTIHVCESHPAARLAAAAVVRSGGRTVVAAGGAGTLNAVLEGILDVGDPPPDLRLAVLRKGSADLIGKVLGVPDDLEGAAEAIARALAADSVTEADVLAVDAVTPNGTSCRRHVLGFGGVGVFGEVPRFTESGHVRWYKGLLGQAFGDLGPFLAGMTLAAAWWLWQRRLGRVPSARVRLDDRWLKPDTWAALMVLNGDLGRDFPLGRGLALGGGSFRAVLLRYRGLACARSQIRAGRSGELLARPADFHALAETVRELEVRPSSSRPYGINVDGLPLLAVGPSRWVVSGRVRLVDASPLAR